MKTRRPFSLLNIFIFPLLLCSCGDIYTPISSHTLAVFNIAFKMKNTGEVFYTPGVMSSPAPFTINDNAFNAYIDGVVKDLRYRRTKIDQEYSSAFGNSHCLSGYFYQRGDEYGAYQIFFGEHFSGASFSSYSSSSDNESKTLYLISGYITEEIKVKVGEQIKKYSPDNEG